MVVVVVMMMVVVVMVVGEIIRLGHNIVAANI